MLQFEDGTDKRAEQLPGAALGLQSVADTVPSITATTLAALATGLLGLVRDPVDGRWKRGADWIACTDDGSRIDVSWGDVSVELTARMLVLGRVASDRADAERRVRAAIDSGAGLERLRAIIECQGGDPRVIDAFFECRDEIRRECQKERAALSLNLEQWT